VPELQTVCRFKSKIIDTRSRACYVVPVNRNLNLDLLLTALLRRAAVRF